MKRLYAALDSLDERLARARFLVGNTLTEADWRLFTTLVRFDAVYHGHFKCNLRRIEDYPNLSGFIRELFQMPGIADTVNFDHIKRHYYMSHEHINPKRIVPAGPELDAYHAIYWRLLDDPDPRPCPFDHPWFWGAFCAHGAVT